MKVGPTNGRERNANDRFASAGMRALHFFYADIVWSVENVGFHFLHCGLLLIR
jgi:hypothetical protein